MVYRLITENSAMEVSVSRGRSGRARPRGFFVKRVRQEILQGHHDQDQEHQPGENLVSDRASLSLCSSSWHPRRGHNRPCRRWCRGPGFQGANWLSACGGLRLKPSAICAVVVGHRLDDPLARESGASGPPELVARRDQGVGRLLVRGRDREPRDPQVGLELQEHILTGLEVERLGPGPGHVGDGLVHQPQEAPEG